MGGGNRALISGPLDAWRQFAGAGRVLVQGYLSSNAKATVRCGHRRERAVVTIKGRWTASARAEFEYDIPLDDAESLLGFGRAACGAQDPL